MARCLLTAICVVEVAVHEQTGVLPDAAARYTSLAISAGAHSNPPDCCF